MDTSKLPNLDDIKRISTKLLKDFTKSVTQICRDYQNRHKTSEEKNTEDKKTPHHKQEK